MIKLFYILQKMCVLIRPEYYGVSQEKTILSIGIAEKYVETFIDTFYFDIGFEVYWGRISFKSIL